MVKIVSVVAVVVACPAVWITLIVPMIARSRGIPFKLGSLPIDRRDKRLGKLQSFWLAGVLGWGVGLSIQGVMTAVLIDGTQPSLELIWGVIACCFVTAFWTRGEWTYPLDK